MFLFLHPQESEFLEKNTDWIYEWSSRPDQAPPKYENLILYFLIPRKIVRQIDLFIISCVTRNLSIFPFFFFFLHFRDWKFKHPQGMNKRKSYSIRTTKVGKIGLFSKEVLYTLVITNILSVLVGAGLG